MVVEAGRGSKRLFTLPGFPSFFFSEDSDFTVKIPLT
jgi:hypothetical protein